MWPLCRSLPSQCNSLSSCLYNSLRLTSLKRKSRSMLSRGRPRLHLNRLLLTAKKSHNTLRRSTTLRRRWRSQAKRTCKRTMRVIASKRSKRSAQTRRISRLATRRQTRMKPWARSCKPQVSQPASSAIVWKTGRHTSVIVKSA